MSRKAIQLSCEEVTSKLDGVRALVAGGRVLKFGESEETKKIAEAI